MGLYSRVIFPRFYDLVMDKPHMAELRRSLLADIEGEGLEIGVGTGLNLPHYPASVRKITTVDPNPGMNRILRRRIATAGVNVDMRLLSGEKLPFADDHFDFVVSTWTLCSIPDVRRAIAELFRVLKPGARFYFLEHGLSDDPRIRKWQRRLNRFQMWFADGCRLDLDVRTLLGEPPFQALEMDQFYLEKTARTHGCMYRGWATK